MFDLCTWYLLTAISLFLQYFYSIFSSFCVQNYNMQLLRLWNIHNLVTRQACGFVRQLLSHYYGTIFLSYVVKSCDYMEDADVSKLCGSGSLHLVRCPGCFSQSIHVHCSNTVHNFMSQEQCTKFVMMTGEGQAIQRQTYFKKYM